eukprot:gene5273-6408_t
MRIAATAFAQASGQILGRRSLFGQYGSQTLAPAGLCLPFVREFAAVNDNTVMNVFDRQLKKLHRDRASVHISEEPLTSEIARRLLDRLKVSDGGMLLGRAGFNLPAVDIDTITMMYPNAYELVEHLRVMGETNAVLARRGSVSRDTALATAAAYQALFQEDDGSVPATFDAIFLTGWCPHHNQQR